MKNGNMPNLSIQSMSIVKNGANWFYWIAALSLINTVILMSGGSVSFLFGLGTTQIIDTFLVSLFHAISNPDAVQEVSSASPEADQTFIIEAIKMTPIAFKAIIIGIDLIIVGIFALFGFFANKFHKWAFLWGLILFALDTVLFFFIGDFLGLIIHAFALFSIFRAFKTLQDSYKENDLDEMTPTEIDYETV